MVAVARHRPQPRSPNILERATNSYLPQGQRLPSSIWDKARLSDIGDKYEILEEAPSLEEYKFNNPFLRGESDFIFFVVQPKFKVKAKKKVVTPINLGSKLNKSLRRKLSQKIGENIDDFSAFFLEELMPISLAIDSSGLKVDDMLLQLIGDKAGLPMPFVHQKATQAINIRIIRKMCQKFGLTKLEQKMMFREYANANSIFKI